MPAPSSRSGSLLRDATALDPRFTPEQPLCRDDLIDRLRRAVWPVEHRTQPTNVVLYGPPGTGKTTVVRHVLAMLRAETRVSTAHTNCWQYTTRPAVLADILIQLGYPAPRKGKPVDELAAKLREWLTKHHGAVVALDELDQCRHATEVVYDLHEASARSGTALGLVLITDRPPAALGLDARTRSRLTAEPLRVSPYTATELRVILTARARQAFHADGIADEVVEQIAATVAERGGDCRDALMVLYHAARRAEQAEAEFLTTAHVSDVLSAADE